MPVANRNKPKKKSSAKKRHSIRSRRPYPLVQGKPELRPSVVLFLDVLGYTDLAKDPEALVPLWLALKKAKPHLRGWRGRDYEPFAIRAFTDNIVLGWPFLQRDNSGRVWIGDTEAPIGYILLQAAAYQFNLTRAGYFVRGGLAVGQHYMDDHVVFGDALITAYELESKHAVNPRIVVCPETEKLIRAHIDYYHPPESAPQNRALQRDIDGRLFLNYAEFAADFDEPSNNLPWLSDQLPAHKGEIEKNLQQHRDNDRVRPKYEWSAWYHNSLVQKHFPSRPILLVNQALLDKADPKRMGAQPRSCL